MQRTFEHKWAISVADALMMLSHGTTSNLNSLPPIMQCLHRENGVPACSAVSSAFLNGYRREREHRSPTIWQVFHPCLSPVGSVEIFIGVGTLKNSSWRLAEPSNRRNLRRMDPRSCSSCTHSIGRIAVAKRSRYG